MSSGVITDVPRLVPGEHDVHLAGLEFLASVPPNEYRAQALILDHMTNATGLVKGNGFGPLTHLMKIRCIEAFVPIDHHGRPGEPGSSFRITELGRRCLDASGFKPAAAKAETPKPKPAAAEAPSGTAKTALTPKQAREAKKTSAGV